MSNNPYPDIRVINQVDSTITRFATNSPLFICVISYTDTSLIPGITAAGANEDFVKYTPAADTELLYYGCCKCIDKVPITPEGNPTPAIITRAVLQLADIPFQVVDAGSKIKPSIPYLSFGIGPGYNIESVIAVDATDVNRAFEYGLILGKQLGKYNDLIVLGESIPGGTTTALGVLQALGIDAEFKVSSSMQTNPHHLKNRVVKYSLQKSKISFGELKNDPLKAIAFLGDPMMPSVAGISEGVLAVGGRVLLAGGTQMAAVLAILKSLGLKMTELCIGTTVYVAYDYSSNLAALVNSISTEVPVFAADLHMGNSIIPGLKAFARGFVKDGVGAGGTSIAAMLKSKGKINGNILLKTIEKEYECLSQGG
ncbi:MAG: TIGR00303 family protein [Candidatus Nitrosopolaris sp.]